MFSILTFVFQDISNSQSEIIILLHSKKGIVTLTSELLFEFQKREHSEARAKLVCVSGGSSSKIH